MSTPQEPTNQPSQQRSQRELIDEGTQIMARRDERYDLDPPRGMTDHGLVVYWVERERVRALTATEAATESLARIIDDLGPLTTDIADRYRRQLEETYADDEPARQLGHALLDAALEDNGGER